MVVPSHMNLQDFSVQIKLALQLPYTDYGWHSFSRQGITYMLPEIQAADYDYRWDWHLPRRRYRDIERARLSQLFTVLQSAFRYEQEDRYVTHHVRCTLLERLP